MDHEALLALFDRRMRREAPPDGPGARVERTPDVVRQVAPAHGWNGVLWSAPGLTPERADRVIAAEIRRFASAGLTFEWKLYAHDLPGDLGERLLAAGFRPEPEEALMVAETARLATAVAPPPGIELRPVTDAAGVRLMTRVHDEAFGTDGTDLGRWLTDRLADEPETLAAVVATAGDRPVSAARLELPPDRAFAGLWGGGTVPEWRGRGLYRALVAHRARIAAERGYRHLHVDASDDSRPILLRLGFRVLSTTTPYVYRP
ncbi:GNAT family N-acetyltransferase [Streptomyces sp. NPDC047928]|uniref:GNAT family N-acetyltransferase n=1 Tax=unclassified Streptomyces TaxID=2593676 RepID=UPI00371D401E